MTSHYLHRGAGYILSGLEDPFSAYSTWFTSSKKDCWVNSSFMRFFLQLFSMELKGCMWVNKWMNFTPHVFFSSMCNTSMQALPSLAVKPGQDLMSNFGYQFCRYHQLHREATPSTDSILIFEDFDPILSWAELALFYICRDEMIEYISKIPLPSLSLISVKFCRKY